MEDSGLATLLFHGSKAIIMTFLCYEELLCACILKCIESSACVYRGGFAPIFPDICYHLTHYRPAAADIPV
ncbi:hypothetical protein, partial [Salmonella enterica]|uniref:hypothetical protein n=1 Tax=Salmonella enterica TaxID=28901 RepID=UPI001C712626